MLEKFRKNKKNSRIIIASVLGIMLIVGVVTLFRSFAFFEEKRDFNVLKGRVPEFSHEDIQLAFTIDGQKGDIFPSKNSRYVAESVVCDKGVSAEWSIENWALTNINSNGNKKIYCSIQFKTINEIKYAQVGDYVSYTPNKTNFEVSNDLTGVSNYSGSDSRLTQIKSAGKQTIHPNMLTLWRVIRKNSDGSIELISTSALHGIYFYGKEGYKKYIGTLNTIARSFETNGITSGSRYMGYHDQTENITNETELNKTTNPYPYTTFYFDLDYRGLGDTLYTKDEKLIEQAIGSRMGTLGTNGMPYDCFIANRWYSYGSNTGWSFNVRTDTVSSPGSVLKALYSYENGYKEESVYGAIRPIVILKSDIQSLSGDGSESNPWKVN